MSKLLIKPQGSSGKIHDISAKSAGWGYVGFSLYLLERGQNISQDTLDQEVILVLVEGHAEVTADGKNFGILGDRLDVFEKSPPHCVYVPSETDWFINPSQIVHLRSAQHRVQKSMKLHNWGPTVSSLQLVEKVRTPDILTTLLWRIEMLQVVYW